MGDDSGKAAGAAAGAGGLGLMAFLRLCSHEGAEVGVAARALQGVERGVVQEGALAARAGGRAAEEGALAARAGGRVGQEGRLAGRAIGAGENVGLHGAGYLAAEGKGFGHGMFELLPNLMDLPLPLGDDDDDAPRVPSGHGLRPGEREATQGALLERAFRNGEPLGGRPSLAAAWPARSGERTRALPVSRSPLAFQYEPSSPIVKKPEFMSLAPRSAADFELMFGAKPTPAETAQLADQAWMSTSAMDEPGSASSSRGSRDALLRTIAGHAIGSVLVIVGWSRGDETRITLRDGTHVREGDLHAACLSSFSTCFVLRRTGARGDARGAFGGEDGSMAMALAARARTVTTRPSSRDLVAAMTEAREKSAQGAARALKENAAPRADKAPPANDAPAPRASTVSLTALVSANEAIHALVSDEAR
jgi:hypothetical protein